MSKTTKIIAALGVVAGLGVAALPAASFADDDPKVDGATGDVEVIVEVDPAIALEIAGNNDDDPCVYEEGGSSNSTYCNVTDITPDGTTFTWGSGDDAVTLTESSIKTSSSKINMTQNQFIAGAVGTDANGFASTLKVTTNDKSGYNLTVKAKTASDVNLMSGTDHINAIASAGALTAGTEGWGMRLSAAAGENYTTDFDTTNWTPASTAAKTVVSAPAAAAGYKQDTTVMLYGVATDVAQPTGTYQATLTYTATAK